MNDKVQHGAGVPGGELPRANPSLPLVVDISLQGQKNASRAPIRSTLLYWATLGLFFLPPMVMGYLFPQFGIALAVFAGMVLGLFLGVTFFALTQGVFTWQWVAMKPLRALGAGRLIEAEQYFREALDYCHRFGPQDYRRGFMLRTFGDYRNFQGRFAEAKNFYLEALEIQKKNLPQRPTDYCDTLNNCSLLYQFQEDFSSAESLLEQGVSVIRSCSALRRVVWSNGPTTELYLLYNLAHACTCQKKFNRALEVLSQMEHPPDGNRPNYRDHRLAQRAIIALRQGRFEDAISDCEKVSKRNSQLVPLTLAEAHLGLRQYKEAEDLLRGHLDSWDKTAGCRFGKPLLLMGRCLLEQKQRSSALAYLERTRRLYHDQGMLGLPSWAEALEEWARILDEQREPNLAQQLRNEAALVTQSAAETAIKPL